MAPPRDRARVAYDAAQFRADGHRVVDLLADHLAAAVAGDPAMAVLPWRAPDDMVATWPADLASEPGGADLVDLIARVVAASNHLHHPRYVGHQVTAPLPGAALVDLASSLLNNGAAVYEMGPVAVAMERSLVRWMADLLGWPAGADGFFTSGGSIGNLTALLAARQAAAGFDVWRGGAAGGAPLAVVCSSETHYCVRRAAQIMGWGEAGAVAVAADDRFRLRADRAAAAIDAAEAAGRRVVALVGSAMSTSTGAIDPLAELADLCAERGVWFHVDGAHGASLALSARHRGRLAGIERADSVVWDAHKMMLMPALCTAVLFRDGRRSYQAFAQEASYLFAGGAPEAEWFNLGVRTMECTKSMMAVKLYLALRVHGAGFFAAYLDDTFALAAGFAERIAGEADFELAVVPDGNIVCFRHVPPGVRGAALDALQIEVRRRLIEGGGFYLVQTRLRGATWLRVTIINPLTTAGDLAALLPAIRTAAGQ